MSSDLWYVKTTDGDVDRLTLDQLDEAFNAGHIDENAMVLPAGSATWARLGDLLGASDPAPPPARSFWTPAPSPAPAPNSLRPTSFDVADLEDDPEAASFRRSSRKGLLVTAMLGALVIGGVGFAARHGLPGVTAPSTAPAAAAAAPPPVVAASPPPPAAVPPPVPPSVATTASSADNRLTVDQKSKLLAADKAREDKAKARKKARGAGSWHPSSHKYKSQGFTTGGSKYDPLNASM